MKRKSDTFGSGFVNPRDMKLESHINLINGIGKAASVVLGLAAFKLVDKKLSTTNFMGVINGGEMKSSSVDNPLDYEDEDFDVNNIDI